MKQVKKSRKTPTPSRQDKLTSYILQAGLAFVFFYAGVASLQHPIEWLGFLPHFLAQSSMAMGLLKTFAIFEIVLAVWLVSGQYIIYSASLATLMLAGIVLTDLNQILIVFRDVGLLCASGALVTLHTKV